MPLKFNPITAKFDVVQNVPLEMGKVISDPTGFSDRTQSTISFDNSLRRFTIAPVSGSYVVYQLGKKYTISSALTFDIDNVEGNHGLFLDGGQLIEISPPTFDAVRDYVFVTIIYWSVSLQRQVYFADERHGHDMDWQTHSYLHTTRGAAIGKEYTNLLGTFDADNPNPVDASAQFSVSQTLMYDEDIEHLQTAKGSTQDIYVYYRTGSVASPQWVDSATTFGVVTTGTGRAAINEISGGTWVLTEVTNNNFLMAHVFVFNDPTRGFGVHIGQSQYSTIGTAREAAYSEIASIKSDSGFPIPEVRYLGTIIYQTSNSYTNTPKSRVRTTDLGDNYIDWTLPFFLVVTSGGTPGTAIVIWGPDFGEANNIAGRTFTGNAVVSSWSYAADYPFTAAGSQTGNLAFSTSQWTALGTPAHDGAVDYSLHTAAGTLATNEALQYALWTAAGTTSGNFGPAYALQTAGGTTTGRVDVNRDAGANAQTADGTAWSNPNNALGKHDGSYANVTNTGVGTFAGGIIMDYADPSGYSTYTITSVLLRFYVYMGLNVTGGGTLDMRWRKQPADSWTVLQTLTETTSAQDYMTTPLEYDITTGMTWAYLNTMQTEVYGTLPALDLTGELRCDAVEVIVTAYKDPI